MIEVPFLLLPVLVVIGLLAGLYGYSQARRHAFRDLIAAQGRAGFLRASDDCQ